MLAIFEEAGQLDTLVKAVTPGSSAPENSPSPAATLTSLHKRAPTVLKSTITQVDVLTDSSEQGIRSLVVDALGGPARPARAAMPSAS